MTSSELPLWRIGIDVGGTFTDFIAVPTDGQRCSLSGALRQKSPSTPSDPARAVGDGLRELATRGVDPADVEVITHGTTIGLNAILQGRGASVALLTSTGHRDMLQIGRARLPRSFDLHAEPPPAPVPRHRIVEVDSRFSPDGAHRGGANAEIVYQSALDGLRRTGAEAVAVSLVGAYAAVDVEKQLAARLEEDLGIPITSAAAVWPQAGEFERTTLAVLNAQIAPLMSGYFEGLSEVLASLGFTSPLYITTSNGGSVSLESATERPIDTVLSGPAAGVSATARLWPNTDVVTIDMGGTSSDIGVLRAGRPTLTTKALVGELPLITPVVEVTAIGAGGGSVVWADHQAAQAVLRVGPRSAGADPGPAAYDRGGQEATITDAYVQTGIIDASSFLGGDLPLNAQRAQAALAHTWEDVGFSGSGDPAADAAESALRIASAGMSTRLRTVLARHGESSDHFALVAFGGAGGTHSTLLADEVGAQRVIVPAAAATFCALGAAITPVRRDFVRSVTGSFSVEQSQHLAEVFNEMVAESKAWYDEQGSGGAATLLLSADLKYAGQPTVIEVELAHLGFGAPEGVVAAVDPFRTRRLFDESHTRQHGFHDTQATLIVEALRLSVIGPELTIESGDEKMSLVVRGKRRLRHAGEWIEALVLEASSTATTEAHEISGPAIVERHDTSVLIPPSWVVTADSAGNLLLHKENDDLAA